MWYTTTSQQKKTSLCLYLMVDSVSPNFCFYTCSSKGSREIPGAELACICTWVAVHPAICKLRNVGRLNVSSQVLVRASTLWAVDCRSLVDTLYYCRCFHFPRNLYYCKLYHVWNSTFLVRTTMLEYCCSVCVCVKFLLHFRNIVCKVCCSLNISQPCNVFVCSLSNLMQNGYMDISGSFRTVFCILEFYKALKLMEIWLHQLNFAINAKVVDEDELKRVTVKEVAYSSILIWVVSFIIEVFC